MRICCNIYGARACGVGVRHDGARKETTPDAQVNVGGIVFDTNDFNYTEDYAAFVDTAGVVNNESVLYDPDRREQKTRLDDGKSGLYLETKKTATKPTDRVLRLPTR